MNTMRDIEFVPDWSGLPPELLEEIAKCLPLVEDFTAFRGVCTTWRAAVLRKKFKVPLLMLAEKHPSHKYSMRKKHYMYTCKVHCLRKKKKPSYKYDLRNKYQSRKCKVYRLYRRKEKNDEERHDEREFYSLSKRKICSRLPFPEAKDKKCIDVGFGWMLTVSALGSTIYGRYSLNDIDSRIKYGKFGLGDISDGSVSLVKPFYPSQEIELPNLNTFPKYEESERHPDFEYVAQGVLLADPSETSDFMLVLLSTNYLIIWKNGDKKWTRITPSKPVREFLNMVYYKGCILAVTCSGRIWSWSPNGTDITKARVIMDDVALLVYGGEVTYLVESTDGELLVIVRNNTEDSKRQMGKEGDFRVMKVDLDTRTSEPKNSVGKDAIFVGNNTTVAVAATNYPGVLKPNCIYFTGDNIYAYGNTECDKGRGMDMGIYNVEDESIERFQVESYSHISPPMWVFLSF